MTELHDRFRTLDNVRPPDLWAEIAERAGADAGYRPADASRTRLVILLAALMLLAALAGAIVIGALQDDGLDRSENPIALLAPIAQPCNNALPGGVVLIATSHSTTGEGEPTELTIYEDGLVIDGVSAFRGGSFNSLQATWSQRRLTARGVATLLDTVAGALPSCRSFPSDDFASIMARTSAGVHTLAFGPPSAFETRATSAVDAAAAAAILEQLAAPDLGLPADGWLGGDWSPYVPDRWRFSLMVSPPAQSGFPSPEDVVMPGGSTLRDFGGDAAVIDVMGARCVVVPADEATAIGSALTAAGGGMEEAPTTWVFEDDVGVINVAVAGLLPHEPDCETEPFGTPGPSPPPVASAPDSGTLADACDYVPPSAIGDLGVAGDLVEHHVAWSGDWHMCWIPYREDAIVVASSRHAVPADQAADQARNLLGEEGFVADDIGGHAIFFNACLESGADCRAAVALSAEPHFLVIAGAGREVLRTLASGIIGSLEPAE